MIAFTDQDCIVPPDWIARLEAHLRDSSIAGAGGAWGSETFRVSAAAPCTSWSS